LGGPPFSWVNSGVPHPTTHKHNKNTLGGCVVFSGVSTNLFWVDFFSFLGCFFLAFLTLHVGFFFLLFSPPPLGPPPQTTRVSGSPPPLFLKTRPHCFLLFRRFFGPFRGFLLLGGGCSTSFVLGRRFFFFFPKGPLSKNFQPFPGGFPPTHLLKGVPTKFWSNKGEPPSKPTLPFPPEKCFCLGHLSGGGRGFFLTLFGGDTIWPVKIKHLFFFGGPHLGGQKPFCNWGESPPPHFWVVFWLVVPKTLFLVFSFTPLGFPLGENGWLLWNPKVFFFWFCLRVNPERSFFFGFYTTPFFFFFLADFFKEARIFLFKVPSFFTKRPKLFFFFFLGARKIKNPTRGIHAHKKNPQPSKLTKLKGWFKKVFFWGLFFSIFFWGFCGCKSGLFQLFLQNVWGGGGFPLGLGVWGGGGFWSPPRPPFFGPPAARNGKLK